MTAKSRTLEIIDAMAREGFTLANDSQTSANLRSALARADSQTSANLRSALARAADKPAAAAASTTAKPPKATDK
jgi:hypothetical protein